MNSLKPDNCLVLYHVEHPYLFFHIDEYKKYFNSVEKFNYVGYFNKYGLKSLEEKINDIIKKNQITYIILFQWYTCFVPTISFLQTLREKVFINTWLFDDDVFFHSYGKFYNQAVDAVVTTDYFGKIMYDQLNIPSILYIVSYDAKIYKPIETIEKDIDVSFVGSITKADRNDYLQYLKDNDIKVQIFGQGSNNGMISEEEMIKIFNRSKINLNFTKIRLPMSIYEDNPLLNRVRQNKGRPIEIGLTKSFCLSEYSSSLDILFDKNSEIDTFDSKEELLEKIKFYLYNDDLRKEYSDNLYKKCLSQYQVKVYLNSVFNKLASIKSRKNYKKINHYGIHKSRLFKIREKAFFLTFAKSFFKEKKYKLAMECISYILKTDKMLIINSILFNYKKFEDGESK